MREIRLFTPQILRPGSTIELDKNSSRHASQALRLKPRQDLILFNGDGFNYLSRIVESGKSTLIKINEQNENRNESSLNIELIQCISRTEKMDFTLQKSTELGVTKIQAVFSQRTIISIKGSRFEKKMMHWKSVIQSACEQSGRSVIPELANPMKLSDYFQRLPYSEGSRLLLAPSATRSFTSIELKNSHCELLVGPEGGLSDEEIINAEKAGFMAISLGPRTLRTETAGLSAISVLQFRFGDLG